MQIVTQAFSSKLSSAVIRKGERSDISQIKALMENVFGPFDKLEELFTKWITQDQYSVRVATLETKIIGVCTWYLKTDIDYSKYDSFGTTAIDFIKDKKSAWVMNLAVFPQFRKEGLGKKLALANVEWLKKTNCDVVAGSSWVNGTEENSQHLYLKAGFLRLGESQEFLRAQLTNGAICSVCKTSDCSCNSILFGIATAKLIHFMESQYAD